MRKTIAVLALSLLAANVMAAVSPEEAAVGHHPDPGGRRKAGNADGSIPAWTGGIPKMPVRWTARASWPTRSPVKNRCL